MKGTELTVTVIYLLGCIGIGLWAMRKFRSTGDDYWVAGRRVSTFMNSWAIMAALASGGSVLGVCGLGYKLGIPYAFSMFAGAVMGFPMASILVARQLRNLGKYTITDLLVTRYDHKVVKWATPIIVLLAMGAYIVAQMKAAGVTAQFLLGIPYQYSVMLTALVFIVYVSIGGMWAVTVTDIIQGMLVFFMMSVVGIVAISHFGGVGSLVVQAAQANPAVGTLAALPLSSYIGAFVVWAAAVPVIPHVVMRIYTSRDVRSARFSLNYAMLLYAFMIFFGVIGVSAAAQILFPGLGDADMAYLMMTTKYLPRVFAGLAVAAVMAAVMSTTDALLLSCSSAFAHDIYAKLIRPSASERDVIRVGTVSAWVIGLLAMFFAFNPPKLLTMMYTAAVGLIVSAFFASTVMGLWWKRATNVGGVAGILIGALLYLYLLWFTKMPSLSHVLVSLPVSFAAVIVGSLVSPPPSDEIVEKVASWHK